MVTIWPNLRLGISYKTLIFFALFLVLYLFAMLRGKVIVWLIARGAISSPLDVWIESVPPDTINAYNFDLCFNA